MQKVAPLHKNTPFLITKSRKKQLFIPPHVLTIEEFPVGAVTGTETIFIVFPLARPIPSYLGYHVSHTCPQQAKSANTLRTPTNTAQPLAYDSVKVNAVGSDPGHGSTVDPEFWSDTQSDIEVPALRMRKPAILQISFALAPGFSSRAERHRQS
ncbi:hypothetical protein N7451_004862 [Penicillium sp. IBT 35674x]|nr:hypothetical protein N7451_004862 [Penicillium sp. IBT 35674x]